MRTGQAWRNPKKATCNIHVSSPIFPFSCLAPLAVWVPTVGSIQETRHSWGLLQPPRNTPLSNCHQYGLPGWASSHKQGLKQNSLKKKAFSTLLSLFFYSAVNYSQLDLSCTLLKS